MSLHPRALVAVLALAASVTAQFSAAARYDLGQRLRRVERAWAAVPATDAERRAAGRRAMESAVRAFFAMNTRDATAHLDAAWIALSVDPAEDPALRRAAAACLPRGVRRLGDVDAGVEVTATAAPDDVPRIWSVDRNDVDAAGVSIRITAPGDHVVALAARGAAGPIALGEAMVSVLDADGRERLDRLLAHEVDRDAAPRLEAESTLGLQRTLGALAGGDGYETDVPVLALLALGERLAAATTAGERLAADALAGESWLRIPVGRRALPVRLLVPPAVDDAPRPLVVALHGMGGSEHLWFDGYGDGLLARLAAERGWIVCAPRAMPAGAAEALVDELAARLPIDRERIYAVGHSMGAATAVAAADRFPTLFAKVAAIGGGGAPKDPERLTAVGFLVAPGEHDFARPQAELLARRLEAAGVPTRLDVIAGVEHMLVVQEALPAVFDWLER